ncbi:zeta toxin family protein [Hazenella coriacea]|uniref:UDP-N-acetylglucosamine kinase n=1 Tax=Hazenella coriacea TaxID=1179467 RepID=A0A4R3L4E0_9BACL|nr:zeta toxin family protein [Hazenella coriacea]TCS93590.1 zeta toxin [Hazenella coriacea]
MIDSQKYKLSKAEHQHIFEYLKQEMFAETTPVKNPTIVILGGQPGSGKANMIDLSRHEFPDRNCYFVNGDELRKEHPHHQEIFRHFEQDYARLTDPDVRVWTKELFDLAIETKRNIIFEGTMRQAEPLCQTLLHLKHQGYKVIIRILAVNEQLSFLGTIERYEGQKQIFGHGRSVPKNSHDAAYQGLLQTVKRIEHGKLFNTLQVYNRNHDLLYENQVINHQLIHPPRVAESIIKERSRAF